MKKTVIIIIIITLGSKVLGFLRDIVLAYFYGASSISDAFIVSMIIPTVIFGIIGTGIYLAFIPIYSNIVSQYGRSESDKFTNNVINLLLTFSTVLLVICLVFTEPLVKIFAYGFENSTLEMAVSFSRFTLVSILFLGVIYIFNGYLPMNGNHTAPILMGLPINLVLILGIFLSGYVNIYLLPLGKVFSVLVQLILLVYFVRKQGFRYHLFIDLKSVHLRKMKSFAVPIILGSSVEQINTLVDKTLASRIAVGGISALNYANQLNLFVHGIFVSSIAVVFYPLIAKMAASKDIISLKITLTQTLIVISALVVPATVGTIIFAEYIVEVLFGRGNFTSNDIEMTSDALYFYSLGMIGFGFREVLNKVFYSLENTRTPMINSAIAVTMNIILNFILSKYLGISGLALATSISGVICTILLLISLRKEIGSFQLKRITVSSLKILLVSLILGVLIKMLYIQLQQYISIGWSLFLVVLMGAALYIVCIYKMRIREIDDFVNNLKDRINKRQREME